VERRDAALVALLFSAALRRSELAGLDYAQAGDGDEYLRLTNEAVGGSWRRAPGGGGSFGAGVRWVAPRERREGG
jgi:site-specific recombinase XerC